MLQRCNRQIIFLKIILSTSRKRCHQAKSAIFSGRRSKTQNGDQNRIYPSLTLQTAKLFPLKRVLKLSETDQNVFIFRRKPVTW